KYLIVFHFLQRRGIPILKSPPGITKRSSFITTGEMPGPLKKLRLWIHRPLPERCCTWDKIKSPVWQVLPTSDGSLGLKRDKSTFCRGRATIYRNRHLNNLILRALPSAELKLLLFM